MGKNIMLLIIFTLIVTGCSVAPSNPSQKSMSMPGEINENILHRYMIPITQ